MDKLQGSKLMRDMSETLMDEDISILATMYVPNVEETNAIALRNVERQEEIRELDEGIRARREAIRAIDEEIGALQARRHRLVRARDIGNAIVAPIRKLPVEILVEIFRLCIASIPTTRRRRTLTRTKIQSLRPQEAAELLGNVCRTWHMISNDDPQIWSRLVLDTKIRTSEDVRKLLKKSKSHPLDIFVRPRNWRREQFTLDYESGAIFEMLRRELWRTRSFISDMQHRGARRMGYKMFPHGFSINAPMMQTFKYASHGNGYELGHSHCPELQSIALENSGSIVRSFVGHPMLTVRHLVISFHGGPPSLHLLSTFPNLVSLHWVGKVPGQVQVPSTVILQHLKSLRVHAAGSARAFLSHLYVPSLQSLELRVEDPMVAIDAICGDGTVKLTRLYLYCTEIVFEQDIHTMLRQLDHLDTLIIENSSTLDGFLTILAPRDRDFSSVCPQLTTLVITMREIFHPLGLIDFVHRRTRADGEEAVPGIVSCLKLGDRLESSDDLRKHFAGTHSRAIHFMSRDECDDMTFEHASNIFPKERNNWHEVGEW